MDCKALCNFTRQAAYLQANSAVPQDDIELIIYSEGEESEGDFLHPNIFGIIGSGFPLIHAPVGWQPDRPEQQVLQLDLPDDSKTRKPNRRRDLLAFL